ncbi:unnamed protein product [Heligmosomoides polygyrus]|uniref:Uncharacterized protein n=1 Tax=Heligmosomoides polygyrus TaxID=6339 RepID=A0A183FK93_HELPZ|nr:unnamed protein product [Heligmosomoides polygyrus]
MLTPFQGLVDGERPEIAPVAEPEFLKGGWNAESFREETTWSRSERLQKCLASSGGHLATKQAYSTECKHHSIRPSGDARTNSSHRRECGM